MDGCKQRVVLSIGPSEAVIPTKRRRFSIFKNEKDQCVLATKSTQGTQFYIAPTPGELAEKTAKLRAELARAGVTVTIVAPVEEGDYVNLGRPESLCRPMPIGEIGDFIAGFVASALKD
jgi:hypothetical protein